MTILLLRWHAPDVFALKLQMQMQLEARHVIVDKTRHLV